MLKVIKKIKKRSEHRKEKKKWEAVNHMMGIKYGKKKPS